MEQMWTERVPIDSRKIRHGEPLVAGEEDQGMQSDLEASSWEEGESQES